MCDWSRLHNDDEFSFDRNLLGVAIGWLELHEFHCIFVRLLPNHKWEEQNEKIQLFIWNFEIATFADFNDTHNHKILS